MERRNCSILFKQFPPDNEQFHRPPKNIPRFPGERWRQLSPVCMRAPVRIRRVGSRVFTILETKLGTYLQYWMYERDQAGGGWRRGGLKTTNERTNEARGSRERGKGRRAGKEAEPVRAVREGKHEERRRNGRERERERERGRRGEGCGCRDVSVGTAGCEGRNRSPAGSQGLSKVGWVSRIAE